MFSLNCLVLPPFFWLFCSSFLQFTFVVPPLFPIPLVFLILLNFRFLWPVAMLFLCLFVTLCAMLFLCAALRNFFSLLFCSSFLWSALRHSFSFSISVFRFSLAFALCGSLSYYFSLSLCCAVPMCAVPRCSPSFLLFFHQRFPVFLSFRSLWFVAILFLFVLFVALFLCALFFVVLLFSGPPWPLTARRPFPCCSFPTSLRVARCYGVFFFLFVSFAILLLLVFPSLLAPLLSSSPLFLRGGLVLLVLELMALCCLLSPLFFSAWFTGCHSIFACVLLSLCDFWRTCFCRSAQF